MGLSINPDDSDENKEEEKIINNDAAISSNNLKVTKRDSSFRKSSYDM